MSVSLGLTPDFARDSNFFAELKARKLVQSAAACVAAPFALLQGIDIAAARLAD